MNHLETLQNWVASNVFGHHPTVRWWPWATLVLGVVVIIVGGVLFTP